MTGGLVSLINKKWHKMKKWILILFSWIAALIMAQTLRFKFMAAEESVYIFEHIGTEPWGRILVATLELIASVLLLLPRLRVWGALMGVGLMLGAIFFHFTSVGIVIMDDGGLLFWLAVLTFTSSMVVLIMEYRKLRKFLGF